jgi:hypothetical protein
MATSWFDPVWFALCCLGSGGILLALRVAPGPTRAGWGHGLTALLGALTLAAVPFAELAWAAGQPLAVWGAAAAFAGLALVVLLGAPSAHLALALAGRRLPRRLLAGGLLVGCPFLALALVCAEVEPVEMVTEADLARMVGHENDEFPIEPLPVSPLTSDRGRPIAAYRLAGAGGTTPAVELFDGQHRLLTNAELHDQVIFLPRAAGAGNCHGLVFTGGQYWIKGEDVETILADNDYRAVEDVRVNDVAVYRDTNGLIAHTGLVRCVLAEQMILVESKWGKLGTFLHRHDRHLYTEGTCAFYRSPRPGHLLHGVAPENLLSTPTPDLHYPLTPAAVAAPKAAQPQPGL